MTHQAHPSHTLIRQITARGRQERYTVLHKPNCAPSTRETRRSVTKNQMVQGTRKPRHSFPPAGPSDKALP